MIKPFIKNADRTRVHSSETMLVLVILPFPYVDRTSDTVLSDDCEMYIYSVSMLYYGEGYLCGCDAIGSVSAVCSQRGGACTCKPGVGGRTCDQCLPGYYNFTISGCLGGILLKLDSCLC